MGNIRITFLQFITAFCIGNQNILVTSSNNIEEGEYVYVGKISDLANSPILDQIQHRTVGFICSNTKDSIGIHIE